MTGPQPAGGGFRVEVDSASEAIRELEDARDELFEIRHQALELSRVDSPANDSVSLEAALALGNIAVDGKGSFPSALEQGIAQLTTIIEDLKLSLRGYQVSDRL